MTTLTNARCRKPTWHGPHDFWWSASGGGHELIGEPTPEDFEVEKHLTQFHCFGRAGSLEEPEEPESEQMFQAFDRGVTIGRKQAIEKVYETLLNDGHEWGREGGCRRCDNDPCTAIEPLQDLFKEAGIEL